MELDVLAACDLLDESWVARRIFIAPDYVGREAVWRTPEGSEVDSLYSSTSG